MATADLEGMYLFANVNFVPGKYDEWQAAYDELAKYVEKDELTTMTYYFGIPFDYAHDLHGTTHMFAFERYGSKNDLYGAHLKSPAMTNFLTRVPSAMTTGLDLMHYEAIAGYLDKPGDKTECGVMQDIRIACTSPESCQSVLQKLETLAEAVEAREDKEKTGVYTWMAFKSLDDEKAARIYARYKDREAMEKHLRTKEVLDFWFGTKDEIAQMESRGYLPNGKGWLHR